MPSSRARWLVCLPRAPVVPDGPPLCRPSHNGTLRIGLHAFVGVDPASGQQAASGQQSGNRTRHGPAPPSRAAERGGNCVPDADPCPDRDQKSSELVLPQHPGGEHCHDDSENDSEGAAHDNMVCLSHRHRVVLWVPTCGPPLLPEGIVPPAWTAGRPPRHYVNPLNNDRM